METLVLSHAYLPLDRVRWERAVALWIMDKVEILEEYEDREIHSTSLVIKMPAVVRFVRRVRTHLKGFKLSRENVFARDKGRCQYCGVRLSRSQATWDHVKPRAQGGLTVWENIVLSCLECNQKKGCRTPEQAGLRLLTRAIQPRALPPTFAVTLPGPREVPESWRQYLFDLTYWHSDLEDKN